MSSVAAYVKLIEHFNEMSSFAFEIESSLKSRPVFDPTDQLARANSFRSLARSSLLDANRLFERMSPSDKASAMEQVAALTDK